MKTIPYGRQYIDQDDIDAVVEVMKSDWLTQGPKVKEFEEAVAQYHNCKYAVAFSSGTAALHGAYYVSTKFPFGKKDRTVEDLQKFISFAKPTYQEYEKFKEQYWEFITTPITFVASANGGLYCGGTPQFVDISMDTYCIDIEQIEDAITEDTRVITPVSYAGYPVDVEAIRNLPKVQENHICIIHDACHAFGARRNGYGIADFADMTILSFHPVKHITTGEGGMVLTNNREYYEKLLMFRSHGITKDPEKYQNESDGPWYYEMQELGYNYRITDMQCALGLSQLEKVDEFLYKRNRIAKRYKECLKEIECLILPPDFSQYDINPTSNRHAFHLYPVLLRNSMERIDFYKYLQEEGVCTQIHYQSILNFSYYRELCLDKNYRNKLWRSFDFAKAEISLPIFYQLNSMEEEHVIRSIVHYFKRR